MDCEFTLKLIREKSWGPRAMEKRVKECCAANPSCPHEEECRRLYDQFVTGSDDTRREAYHELRKLGMNSYQARSNMSKKRVRLLGDGHG